MADKILLVDDEPAVLDGYKRTLYRDFQVDTSVGGQEGLASMRDKGPYAVVISDMRMPGMNGAQFLAQVKIASPDSVRMLLTGYTDMNMAIEAVNEGNIFRFLTKPCERETLTIAINAALDQHRLIVVEKELLEKTLMGVLKALTDVLSATSPEAFGRSLRIVRIVRHLAAKFPVSSPWKMEAAAMLSQLGCVTLDPDLIKASYLGAGLSAEDRQRFARHPEFAKELLGHIPRMESVAWIISQQLVRQTGQTVPKLSDVTQADLLQEAEMLRIALEFDNHRMRGLSKRESIEILRDRRRGFDSKLVDALLELEPDHATGELRKVPAGQLRTGMVLQQEIRTDTGLLIVPNGHEITQALLIKLDNLTRAGMIRKDILVMVPAK
jgi:response regulator RpfG family c-di-GMP phosphodiesterase